MVGGQNRLNNPYSSRAGFCLLFQSSLVRSDASKALRTPGTVCQLASPPTGQAAHMIPVPRVLPSVDTDNGALLERPIGLVPAFHMTGCSCTVSFETFSAFRRSPSPHI